jgi:Tol biopolymer transport system component
MEGLQLFLIDVDGSEKTLFSDGMGNYRQQRFPSWNVAGYIVFGTHSMGYDWEANLYRLDVASAGGTPTALNPGYAQFPAAGGPAGLIAWSTPSGTLNVMSSDGTGVTPLPATGTSTGKAWQPDTSTLFYVKDGDIWRINADGTEDARVTTGASVVSILGAE